MPKAASVPSVLDPRCPSRLVLDRIADKWTALVIQILAGGTMRYAALQREIGGISQKMLTQTLRSLERDGLVHESVFAVAAGGDPSSAQKVPHLPLSTPAAAALARARFA